MSLSQESVIYCHYIFLKLLCILYQTNFPPFLYRKYSPSSSSISIFIPAGDTHIVQAHTCVERHIHPHPFTFTLEHTPLLDSCALVHLCSHALTHNTVTSTFMHLRLGQSLMLSCINHSCTCAYRYDCMCRYVHAVIYL